MEFRSSRLNVFNYVVIKLLREPARENQRFHVLVLLFGWCVVIIVVVWLNFVIVKIPAPDFEVFRS